MPMTRYNLDSLTFGRSEDKHVSLKYADTLYQVAILSYTKGYNAVLCNHKKERCYAIAEVYIIVYHSVHNVYFSLVPSGIGKYHKQSHELVYGKRLGSDQKIALQKGTIF